MGRGEGRWSEEDERMGEKNRQKSKRKVQHLRYKRMHKIKESGGR